MDEFKKKKRSRTSIKSIIIWAQRPILENTSKSTMKISSKKAPVFSKQKYQKN